MTDAPIAPPREGDDLDTIAEKVLLIVHAFPDAGRREAVRALARSIRDVAAAYRMAMLDMHIALDRAGVALDHASSVLARIDTLGSRPHETDEWLVSKIREPLKSVIDDAEASGLLICVKDQVDAAFRLWTMKAPRSTSC